MRRSFRVEDANGVAVSYIYALSEEERLSWPDGLSWDEATRIAAKVAKLPECISAGRQQSL